MTTKLFKKSLNTRVQNNDFEAIYIIKLHFSTLSFELKQTLIIFAKLPNMVKAYIMLNDIKNLRFSNETGGLLFAA